MNSNSKAFCFGQNENGQCGQDALIPFTKPTLIEHLRNLNIVQISCGEKHSLFLTDTNEVYACGCNAFGQLGIANGNQMVTKPSKIIHDVAPIKKIGCGQNFSVLLDTDGNLYTFGSSKFGQLGYNPNNDCVYSPNIVSFPKTDVKIIDFSCGTNHTVHFLYIFYI